MKCMCCGTESWLPLPEPHPSQSVTTSGLRVTESLGKSHCMACGMVQRTGHRFLGLTDFYERDYSLYYDRAGTESFNAPRYRQIAEWVASVHPSPRRILEVGCGRGWTMREMAKVFPEAVLAGLEPAVDNSQAARDAGFDVFTGKLDEFATNERFDLIFSNHVIQHTVDPVAFLRSHAALLTQHGLAIVTVQDARETTNELLYSDQNFSFLPDNLATLAKAAGLTIVDLQIAPNEIEGIRFSQMLILSLSGQGMDESLIPQAPALGELYEKRRQYIQHWKDLDSKLVGLVDGADHVLNFGAGIYSFLLACYCPTYWARVEACLVDGQSGTLFDKPIWDAKTFEGGPDDVIVLGTRPSAQPALAGRFEKEGGSGVVRWDDKILA